MTVRSEESAMTSILTFVALVLAISVGGPLFFLGNPLYTLAPIAGLIAGIGSRSWSRGALIGGGGAFVGTCGAAAASHPSWGPIISWLSSAAQVSVAAAVIGAVVAVALRDSARLKPLISVVALVMIVGAMWLSAFTLAKMPVNNVQNTIQLMSFTPSYDKKMADWDLYLIWISKLRAGESYYPMAVKSFVDANAARPTMPIGLRSPISYRLPTLYMLLAALPPGIWQVVVMMLVCTGGLLAGHAVSRQFVSEPVALAGSIVLGAGLAGYGGLALLDTETWAGVFGLMAVAAFVLSRTQPDRARLFQVTSVALAVVAVAFRELAAPYLLLGLVASLADRELRASRAWVAWIVGIVVAGAGVVAHWSAAASAYASVVSRPIYTSWLYPDGSGLVGSLHEAALRAWLNPAVMWILVALGIVGALSASSDRATRLVLAGVAIGGPAVLLIVHPPGVTIDGFASGYWGRLVTPTVLACVPFAYVAVTRWLEREKAPAAEE
jgi:hypothetical protein